MWDTERVRIATATVIIIIAHFFIICHQNFPKAVGNKKDNLTIT